MEEREPLVISLLDQTTLNYNLIDGEAYRGCVTIHYTHRAFKPSDKPLIKVLGRAVMNAISKHSIRSPEGPGSLRQALQGLVEERPLDSVERDVVLGANKGERYVCMRMKRSSKLEQLPLGYVRNAVESAFPRSVVFEYRKNSIVAVLRIGDMDSEAYRQAIAEGVTPFIGSMEMKAGISNPFDDLRSVRSLYLQADAALDIGVLFAPSENLYFFNDYALHEMVMDMASVHQIDTLLDEGLRKLIEHDANSSTSYVSTLQSFLNNESSVAKTAAELYVHRSTLMERLSRIRRFLGIDLDDPDERLRLQVLLKAIQVRDELRDQGSE
ncbi:MAG: helix-turn-helix domain-containing protein [Eggerthellaceae bacterium]|nr:helix-turn-helix domain-containing protein [Eggerthellaceae bacterium]